MLQHIAHVLLSVNKQSQKERRNRPENEANEDQTLKCEAYESF